MFLKVVPQVRKYRFEDNQKEYETEAGNIILVRFPQHIENMHILFDYLQL